MGVLCDLDTRRVMMSEIQQFSQHDIEVLNEETVYKGFFTLKKVQFKHKLFAGGESGVVTRE
mgnify:CR=1 FL=1